MPLGIRRPFGTVAVRGGVQARDAGSRVRSGVLLAPLAPVILLLAHPEGLCVDAEAAGRTVPGGVADGLEAAATAVPAAGPIEVVPEGIR